MAHNTSNPDQDRSAILRQMLLAPLNTQLDVNKSECTSSNQRNDPRHTTVVSTIRPQPKTSRRPNHVAPIMSCTAPDPYEAVAAFGAAPTNHNGPAFGYISLMPYDLHGRPVAAQPYGQYVAFPPLPPGLPKQPGAYEVGRTMSGPQWQQQNPNDSKANESCQNVSQDARKKLPALVNPSVDRESKIPKLPATLSGKQEGSQARVGGGRVYTFGGNSGTAAHYISTIAPWTWMKNPPTDQPKPVPSKQAPPPVPAGHVDKVNWCSDSQREPGKSASKEGGWDNGCADDNNNREIQRTQLGRDWEKSRAGLGDLDAPMADVEAESESTARPSANSRAKIENWLASTYGNTRSSQIANMEFKVLPQPREIQVTATQEELEAWPHREISKPWMKVYARKLKRERMEANVEKIDTRAIEAKMPDFGESGW